MAKNAPYGDNHRYGAVKNRTPVYNLCKENVKYAVETSIKDEFGCIKKESIKVALKDAAKDPLFLADIREIEKDFEHVDFEEAEK